MKKNYLAPKSETLMAILRELCTEDPHIDPSHTEGASGGFGSGGKAPFIAPKTSHSL